MLAAIPLACLAIKTSSRLCQVKAGVAADDDAPVGKGLLLADVIVAPAGGVQFWQDVLSAGIRLGQH